MVRIIGLTYRRTLKTEKDANEVVKEYSQKERNLAKGQVLDQLVLAS